MKLAIIIIGVLFAAVGFEQSSTLMKLGALAEAFRPASELQVGPSFQDLGAMGCVIALVALIAAITAGLNEAKSAFWTSLIGFGIAVVTNLANSGAPKDRQFDDLMFYLVVMGLLVILSYLWWDNEKNQAIADKLEKAHVDKVQTDLEKDFAEFRQTRGESPAAERQPLPLPVAPEPVKFTRARTEASMARKVPRLDRNKGKSKG
jgi:hypothetical protein